MMDDGAHHVAVLVFEDVAVVHVAAAVGLEADGELDDLVGVDADGVLEPSFAGVDDVVEFRRRGRGPGARSPVVSRSPIPLPGTVTAIGRRARTWKGSRWMWIGWVSPVRLISCHTSHRPGTGKNVAASSKWAAAVRRRASVWPCWPATVITGAWGSPSAATASSRSVTMFRPAVEFLLGERDGAPDCAAEVRLGGSGDVGGQAPGSGPARRVAGHGAEAHDVGVGQELAWVGGFGGTGGGEGVAAGRGACGAGQGELAARLEVGEVHEQVGPLGGGEHEPVGGDGNGRGQQAAVGADLGDPVEFGSAVAQQDEPEGAGVGPVEHAQPAGRGLHIVDRPHLTVNHGERREGLHRPRVGLVDQLAGDRPPAACPKFRSCTSSGTSNGGPSAGRAHARAGRG